MWAKQTTANDGFVQSSFRHAGSSPLTGVRNRVCGRPPDRGVFNTRQTHRRGSRYLDRTARASGPHRLGGFYLEKRPEFLRRLQRLSPTADPAHEGRRRSMLDEFAVMHRDAIITRARPKLTAQPWPCASVNEARERRPALSDTAREFRGSTLTRRDVFSIEHRLELQFVTAASGE
jgi:hypothetical protein